FDETGLDFRVVQGTGEDGQKWIVRIPRRRDVVETAQVESRVLSLVAAHLPVSVPGWTIHAEPIIAYRRREGTPIVTIDPARGPTWNVVAPDNIPEVFLDSFAETLAALQSIEVEQAVAAGVRVRSVAKARAAVAQAFEATRKALAP